MKFQKWNLVTALALLIISQFALAQRTVGNGGGTAELKAVYLNEQMPSILGLCLGSSNICSLSATETNKIKAIVSLFQNKLKSTLRFSSEISQTVLTSRKAGEDITINQKALYKEDYIPAAPKDIAAIVFASYLYKVTDTDFQDLLPRAKEILKFINEKTEVIDLSDAPAVLMHHWELNIQSQLHHFVVLETDEGSLDITDKILHTLRCPKASQFDLSNLRAFKRYPKVYGSFDLAVVCADGMHDSGTLVVEAPLNQGLPFKLEQIVISIRQ